MNYKEMWQEGLWRNNVVLSQMLALCPTLAVTTSASNGFGMGVASLIVLVASNTLIAAIAPWVSREVRIPIFIVTIATLVTMIDLALNAWLHELHRALGLFIALIVANCAILGRAEAFASKAPVREAMFDGLSMGMGFVLALTSIGLFRELIGAGTMFAQASVLLGEPFAVIELRLWPGETGMLLMLLPPGGFLVLGLLLAAKQAWERRASTASPDAPAIAAGAGT